MAVAAFKSSSTRGNQSSTPSNASPSSSSYSSGRPSRKEARNKTPIRRSRSVSAFSRGNSNISTEFLNKRDNPLFWSSETHPARYSLTLEPSDSDGTGRDWDSCHKVPSQLAGSRDGGRGRHVAWNGKAKSASTGGKETGQSLSRVDTGRRTRSASQCPASRRRWNYSTSESETEGKNSNSSKFVGSNRKGGLFGSDDGLVDQVRDLQKWSNRHSSTEVSNFFAATLSSLETQKFEDAVSTASSGYGSDVKPIKAVCEQMKSVEGDHLEASDIYETVLSEVRRAITEIQNDLESANQRSNATAVSVTSIVDILPYMVNPGTEEMVLEIRRVYSKKLEESQERARNLRANLAVEEQCEQELDRILKEVVPYPKIPILHKSHPARKTSIERRRMSKRLAEDAKAYFDECVSLSTFDSSDFSSQEDPPLTSAGAPTPSGSYEWLHEDSSTQGPSMKFNHEISQPSADTDSKSCFFFSQKHLEISGSQDIQRYIKKFEKNVLNPNMRSNYCDISENSYRSSAESLLTDMVLLKNRIESGSLLLCGGGNILSSNSLGVGI